MASLYKTPSDAIVTSLALKYLGVLQHIHLCVSAAGTDYTAVNTPEIRFNRNSAQIRDSESINVMTLTDGEDEEEETFYLNFNPTRNAIFIPPRIEIKICGSKCNPKFPTILQNSILLMHFCIIVCTSW